jgi:hypothetical protein
MARLERAACPGKGNMAATRHSCRSSIQASPVCMLMLSSVSHYRQTARWRMIARARRESVWTLTSFKALAKFRVERVSVGQECVERTLLAKIVDHGIVGDAAQGESACRLFHHYEHQHGYLGLCVECGGMASGIAKFFPTFIAPGGSMHSTQGPKDSGTRICWTPFSTPSSVIAPPENNRPRSTN